jgi:preprotein translocase subunit SecA
MFCPDGVHPSEWDTDTLFQTLNEIFPLEVYAKPSDLGEKKREELVEFLDAVVERTYQDKEAEVGEDAMRDIERHITLQLINSKWMDHLESMDYLQEGIGLRGYAQQDPLVAYKKEAYEMYMGMQHSIQEDIVRWMYRVQIAKPEPQRRRQYYNVVESGTTAGGNGGSGGGDGHEQRSVPRRASGKIGRNDPCPCDNGKKYKKCCLLKGEQ